MAIYTHIEMIEDCRAGKAEGWSHFITHYFPICRALIAHYYPDRASDAGLPGRVLAALRDPASPLFRARTLAPEREFVTELRQAVLAEVERDRESATPEIALNLATLAGALAPLTPLEKQIAWLETMRYDAPATARMLNIETGTVERIRDQAAEALRSTMDHWYRAAIADNGAALGREAAALARDACVAAKTFLDLIDGRMTWARKQDAEQRVNECWHCVDHFCRIREVDHLMRDMPPLAAEEAAEHLERLGIAPGKQPFWKRLIAGA